MSKITFSDIGMAQFKCEEKSDQSKIVLKGNCPVLLTTCLFDRGFMGPKQLNRLLLHDSFLYDNYSSCSNLDGLLYVLNEQCGVHSIIEYPELTYDIRTNKKRASVEQYYSNDWMQKYLKENKIDALVQIMNGVMVPSENVDITEYNSSFSFTGMTGISRKFCEFRDKQFLSGHEAFMGCPEEFKENGYDFTDDTIAHNQRFSIGVLKNQLLSREQMWPRTVKVGISPETKLETVANVLVDYLEWMKQELHEKGPYQAMEPMKPKEKLKK